MAKIRIDLSETILDGMDIKFKAPCACSEVTGLVVYYPKDDDTVGFKEFTFRDAHGNDLTGVGNLFSRNAYVKVIVDVENGYAYLQNADTNGYLNSAILGTYTHDAENLIGRGENGKFKATVSGMISHINVNGVSCSVKCGAESTMDLIAGCWYTFILDGNTVNFNSGGAGASLNFKVVGGTTQPVSPSENTIWVNTNTPITTWVISGAQPVSILDGGVWLCTGSSSTAAFNALKTGKNAILVHPISAKHYVSGSWINVTAKSYQSGKWCEWWNGELFENGNEFEGATGGWAFSHDGENTGTYMRLGSTTANSNENKYVRTVSPVSLTGRNTVEAHFLTGRTQFGGSKLNIEAVDASGNIAATVTVVSGAVNPIPETTGILDVSTLSGNYYIQIVIYWDSSSNAANIEYVDFDKVVLN